MINHMFIRSVEIAGLAGMDVEIARGRIVAIGKRLPGRGDEIDGGGGALLPGLIDHHIHLLGTAAHRSSIILDGVTDVATLAARLLPACAARPAGTWLRAVGCPPAVVLQLDRDVLDRIAPNHPLRLQDQSGGLWVLNARALDVVGGEDLPAGVERDARGRPTGRVWREDAWLRERIGSEPPPLAPIGLELARHGITAVTDASASTGPEQSAIFAAAIASGALPQRLTVMSAAALSASDTGFAIGPVKILLDARDLPPLGDMIARIAAARAQQRAVAVHCVTAAELALTLAAFEAGGTIEGDRIEHGSVIPHGAIPVIQALGLIVVTQPGFIAERGDRYRAEVDPADQGDLYRCASLTAAGIPVLGSSDAPYASFDCWAAMRAAVARRSASGALIGGAERVSATAALDLFVRGGRYQPRAVAIGGPADLCLLKRPLKDLLGDSFGDSEHDSGVGPVAATFIGGKIVYGG